jgi:hypothetical protein
MRVKFEFTKDITTAREEWYRTRDWLTSRGARVVKEPQGQPPYELVAIVTMDTEPAAFVEGLRKRPGIGRAELDQSRSVA